MIETATHVVFREGRQLSGSSFGPLDGRAVLFIAGAATGKSMHFGHELLYAARVRLLTMDRPGMGGSTVDVDRTLQSTVDDYRTFVQGALGSSALRIPVVANSQGSVFGLSAAVAGWASRLVLVSPADEVSFPPISAMLPVGVTQLARLASVDPDAAQEVLSAFDASAMEAMVLGGASENDRSVYTSPDFLALYRRALHEGFANSGSGYVRDTLIAMRPWDLPLGDIDCPVRVLFGAEDLGHSPDHAVILADRIPTARRDVIGDAGGALLWTHAARVLESLDD